MYIKKQSIWHFTPNCSITQIKIIWYHIVPIEFIEKQFIIKKTIATLEFSSYDFPKNKHCGKRIFFNYSTFYSGSN